MNGCKITCYVDADECKNQERGWCSLFDRPCTEIHINLLREDGEE